MANSRPSYAPFPLPCYDNQLKTTYLSNPEGNSGGKPKSVLATGQFTGSIKNSFPAFNKEQPALTQVRTPIRKGTGSWDVLLLPPII